MYTDGFEIAEKPASTVLLRVRTGKIQQLDPKFPIKSAISKEPRQGKVFLTKTGLAEDEQAYEHHGGIDKALHQYDVGHYESWNEEKPDLAHLFEPGGFGENISTSGMTEKNVCIGDQYLIGDEVIVEISEPRQPCYKLNRRFKWRKASVQVQETGRAGWYLRVIKTGYIQQGDKMELSKRPYPRWSLSRIQHILYRDLTNLDALQELSQLNELGIAIRGIFQKRLLNGPEDQKGRLKGSPEDTNLVWRPYKLVLKEDLTPRIKRFVFESIDKDGSKNAELRPFSHVRLKFGEYIRAYSVVKGDLHKFELGIARDDNSRGGSRYLHNEFQPGSELSVIEGHANPPKHTNSIKKHVFIIGGIGITAFIQQIQKLKKQGQICEIHYAVKSLKDAAYLNILDSDSTNQIKIYAKDQNQRLDIPSLLKSVPPESMKSTAIYICGPPYLITNVQETANSISYPPTLLHFSDFGSATSNAGPAFTAKLKSTGKVLEIPDGKSLLEVLRETGMDIQSSCEVGNCGVCVVDYWGGKVDHRGVALMEEEKGESLLSCVSRGKRGECLVLDL